MLKLEQTFIVTLRQTRQCTSYCSTLLFRHRHEDWLIAPFAASFEASFEEQFEVRLELPFRACFKTPFKVQSATLFDAHFEGQCEVHSLTLFESLRRPVLGKGLVEDSDSPFKP